MSDPGARIAVSIVIVSYNTAEALRQCLRSIEGTAEHLRIEVIVIDNSSRDGSAALVEAGFPSTKLIRNTHNEGFAKACNQGIRIARGAYILLLNSDVQLLPDTLAKMVDFMDREPTIGAAACQLKNEDGSVQASVRDFPSIKSEFLGALFLDRLFPSSRLFGSYLKKQLNLTASTPVEQVSGAFLMVRRKTMEDVGLLDESFFIYYEDVDWCLRIKNAGWGISYVPACSAVHLGGVTANQFGAFSYVEGMRSKILYFRKHHGVFATLLIQIFAMMEIVTRLLAWLVAFVLPPEGRARAALKGWNPSTALRILRVAWLPHWSCLSAPEPAHG